METVTTVVRPPRWYWIVSWLAVAWMLVGVMAWVMDLMMDEAAFARMSEAQRELYRRRPAWLFADYAVAIFSGLAGAIGLVVRKSWAVIAFGISLAAVFVQFGYFVFGMGAVELIGAAAALPFPLVIIAIGVALLWLSMEAQKRGWIGE